MKLLIVVPDDHVPRFERPLGVGLPYCRCDGAVLRGEDSCLRCGRYKRGIVSLGTVHTDLHLRGLAAFMRERPHAA